MTNILIFMTCLSLLGGMAAGQEGKPEDLFITPKSNTAPAAAEHNSGIVDTVIVNDSLLRSSKASGPLQFQIGAYAFKADGISHEKSASGAYVWRGRVRQGGTALFAGQDGLVFGRIETDKGVFLLRPLYGTQKHCIISNELWHRYSGHNQDTLMPHFPQERTAETSRNTTSTTNDEIPQADVLVLYTTEFCEDHGGNVGANARINYLVELTNQCYANSKVNFRIRLVRTFMVDYDNSTPATAALTDLTEHTNGLEMAGELRDKYGADFVVFMRSLSEEHEYAGLAWFLNESFRGAVALFEEYAYAVVSDGEFIADGRKYFAEETTLAHELGHIMGNDHDRANAGELEPLKRNAYGYHIGNRYRTVMSYPQSYDQDNIPFFSNPHVEYEGIPTGDSENNCALGMNSVAARVTEWRPKRLADNGIDFLDVDAPYIITAKINGLDEKSITDSLDIKITFVALDDQEIVAFKIVERLRQNSKEEGWHSAKPSKRLKVSRMPFHLSNSNKRTRRLYIYVKDAAGNISEKARLKVRYIENDEKH